MNLASVVEATAFNLIRQAVIYLPDDVKQALQKAYNEETVATAKMQLKAILENVALAEERKAPICQDTGTLTFYVKAGAHFRVLDKIEEAIVSATRRATHEIPLRPNAVNPFTQKNSGDNTGRLTPYVHWEVTENDVLEITVLPKGGGSENVCVTEMLLPSDGINRLKRFVVDAVVKAGAQPCPPTVVGVGLGGGADLALNLAKKALLRPISEPNLDPLIAKLETELLEMINKTGIGPMGLGGKTTALGVHIDYAFRHPASFPVAVAFNCWAARRASAKITSGGTVEYLTHKNKCE
ncbi:MAG: fumarate hydratase [Candidatus Bathyarchaeia archaeon]